MFIYNQIDLKLKSGQISNSGLTIVPALEGHLTTAGAGISERMVTLKMNLGSYEAFLICNRSRFTVISLRLINT